MRAATLFLLATLIGLSQTTSSTRGRCSPAITQTGGNVIVTYQSGSCPELDANTVATLKAFVEKFARTIDRLNELLDQKDVELAARAKEIQEWITKYTEVEKQLAERADDSDLSRQAALKLQAGDLEGAGTLLDEIISRGEPALDNLARDHFNRGRVFELDFKLDRALVHYEEASRYRPENTEYAFGYAWALEKQNRHAQAARVYEQLLIEYRKLAQGNPGAYLLTLANTLNNLGNVYRETRRLWPCDPRRYRRRDRRRHSRISCGRADVSPAVGRRYEGTGQTGVICQPASTGLRISTGEDDSTDGMVLGSLALTAGRGGVDGVTDLAGYFRGVRSRICQEAGRESSAVIWEHLDLDYADHRPFQYA
jgi:hypothetical protein